MFLYLTVPTVVCLENQDCRMMKNTDFFIYKIVAIILFPFLLTACGGKVDVDKQSEIDAENEIGYKYAMSNPDSAIIKLEKTRTKAKEAIYSKGEARALNSLGFANGLKGNYSEAFKCFTKALKIYDRLDYVVGKANVYSNISIIFSKNGSYNEAIKYLKLSLAIDKEIKDSARLAIDFLNLGDVYRSKRSYDSALFFTLQSRRIANSLNDIYLLNVLSVNLGHIYRELKINNEAMIHYQKMLPIMKENDIDAYCEVALGLAKCYKEIGMEDSSIHFANEVKLKDSSENGYEASNLLSAIYLERCKKDNSCVATLLKLQFDVIKHFELNRRKNPSVNSSIRELEEYEFEKARKAEEHRKLRNSQYIGMVLIVSIIVMWILYVLIFSTKSAKKIIRNSRLIDLVFGQKITRLEVYIWVFLFCVFRSVELGMEEITESESLKYINEFSIVFIQWIVAFVLLAAHHPISVGLKRLLLGRKRNKGSHQ
jgi:tetratricopeptide (TPR) repeat protein